MFIVSIQCRHQQFNLMSFNFDNVVYGSGCLGDVYGFSWCSVYMVLYLAVDMCLLSVPPGFGRQRVCRLLYSIWCRRGFCLPLTGFDVDDFVVM